MPVNDRSYENLMQYLFGFIIVIVLSDALIRFFLHVVYSLLRVRH